MEDIIIGQGKIKLHFSISYFNNEQQKSEIRDLVTCQMNDKYVISLPTTMNNFEINTDIIVGILGCKYGIYSKMNAYARLNYLNKNSRSTNISVEERKWHENRLIYFSMGL